MGRTDIDDALKRLDGLIQEEHQMVQVQVLKVTSEVKDGTLPHWLVTGITPNPLSVQARAKQTRLYRR